MNINDIKIMLLKGDKGDKGDGSYDDTELRELIAETFADVQEEIAQLEQNYLNYMYPVGSIYISVGSTSPAVLFGGTWEQIEDRFLLAKGSTYTTLEATGGASSHTPSGTVGDHTLTTSEIPSHSHKYVKPSTGTAQFYSAKMEYAQQMESISTATVTANQDTGTAGTGGGHSHGFTGTSQDTMPPYLVVNVWKRTA